MSSLEIGACTAVPYTDLHNLHLTSVIVKLGTCQVCELTSTPRPPLTFFLSPEQRTSVFRVVVVVTDCFATKCGDFSDILLAESITEVASAIMPVSCF
jgi:hypothetical protein